MARVRVFGASILDSSGFFHIIISAVDPLHEQVKGIGVILMQCDLLCLALWKCAIQGDLEVLGMLLEKMCMYVEGSLIEAMSNNDLRNRRLEEGRLTHDWLEARRGMLRFDLQAGV